MNKLKEYILPTLIALCAISVSASAAIYSVSGLAKLFAGASFQVMVMAGSLEVAKLVIATLLHQYWKTINKFLKIYLTLSVIVLVGITSMGIYGFLSSAYQNTAIGFETASKEVAFLKQKEAFYQKDLDRLDTELNRISDNVSELSKAKAREVTVSDGRGGSNTSVSTTELRLADSRIKVEEANRASTLASRNVIADSLKSIQTKVLKLEVEASSNAELGPLIYLSELTGKSMDQIINILLLVIIFVFDPLAISLVLAANFAFGKIKEPTTRPSSLPIETSTTTKDEKRKRAVKKKRKTRAIKKKDDILRSDVKAADISDTQSSVEELPLEEELVAFKAIDEGSEDSSVELVETLVVDEHVVDEIVEEIESKADEPLVEPFDVSYTGVKFSDIVKVLQKTPSHYAVLLKDGRKLKLSKDGFTALQREQNSL